MTSPMNLLQRLLHWLLGYSDRVDPISKPPAPAGADAIPPPVGPKKSRTYGLDAADYLPITRDEIKDAARGRSLLGSVWFGRRDLIPPADDPRTRLIDRGMVTQGLIAPEQLAEIHAVGAEMDRLRPTVQSIEHQAAMTAEAVIQAEKEARARIKAQKKAEAADRKQQRAEAIALAQETTISSSWAAESRAAWASGQPGGRSRARRAARAEHARRTRAGT